VCKVTLYFIVEFNNVAIRRIRKIAKSAKFFENLSRKFKFY
jgi:hypothetical protein